MRILSSFLLTTLLSVNTFAGPEVIYGSDNRKDLYESSSSLLKKVAQSTAAMIHLGHFSITNRQNLTFSMPNTNTLGRAMNLCSGQKYAEQKSPASCSGFLVGDDILVTAGHCYLHSGDAAQACKDFAWVFDFAKKNSKDDPTKTIYGENVYLCKTILAAKYDQVDDFAIIKLNRKVKNRAPLNYRKAGALTGKEIVAAIGHPSGLPTKITDRGAITNLVNAKTFSTTLDTFQGNSGSAVIDEKSGVVEGILIAGKIDYVNSIPSNDKSCLVVNKCDENAKNCIQDYPAHSPTNKGEIVYRIKQLDALITKAKLNK